MKVINLGNKDFKYFTKGTVIVLKAGVINEVDDTLVTPKKLKDCYGNRIKIIDETAIVEEYKAFAGDVKAVQPDPTKEPEEGTNEEGEGTQDNGEGTKDPEENEGADKPEECKECYADGKTPNEEDCQVCIINKKPEENSDKEGEGTEIKDENTKPVKETKTKKQAGKKSSKNKNK